MREISNIFSCLAIALLPAAAHAQAPAMSAGPPDATEEQREREQLQHAADLEIFKAKLRTVVAQAKKDAAEAENKLAKEQPSSPSPLPLPPQPAQAPAAPPLPPPPPTIAAYTRDTWAYDGHHFATILYGSVLINVSADPPDNKLPDGRRITSIDKEVYLAPTNTPLPRLAGH